MEITPNLCLPVSGFKIDTLDHVAIRVKDLEVSAKWYEDVLGLKPYVLEAWGEFPIFMLAGKTGIALFPANESNEVKNQDQNPIKIDHFAFHVSQEDFLKAQAQFRSTGIGFEFQDHTYFHSIYLRDPDGHEVELTTIVVDPSEFY